MRIALVIDRIGPTAGGLEQWTCSLAQFLSARRHDVQVLAFEQTAPSVPATLHLLRPVRGILARAAEVAAAVARLAPDVVHDTGTSHSGDVFHAQTGSRRLSQAQLVATHSPARQLRAAISPKSMSRRWQMAWVERRQIRRANRIIAPSRLVARQLAGLHALAETEITLIHNGVDLARWAPERLAPLREAARERLGCGNATVFLVAAVNMHLKGVDTAIRALARLVRGGLDVRLVVAGGNPEKFWTDLVKGVGVSDRVNFQGSVDKMEPLLAAADALVHPTRWDACSLSTIEAGAAGLPAITTAMNGAAELIVPGETGLILPDPENVAELAGMMSKLTDPALRRRLGSAALAASARHDIRVNLEAVEAVLAEVADRRARAA